MTTIEAKGSKRRFFSVYKPGQGRYVRWGTVGGASLIILIGAWWLGRIVLAGYDNMAIQASGVMLWIAIGALITFLVVNKPNLAEFMIMTESEMRKVTWPSRRAVINSTRVVIFMTLLLAVLLWLVDEGFIYLFKLIRIL